MAEENMLSPEDLVLLATILALILVQGRTPSENNVLGNFVVAVGSLILTFAAQQEAVKSATEEAKKTEEEQKTGKEKKPEEEKKTGKEKKPGEEDEAEVRNKKENGWQLEAAAILQRIATLEKKMGSGSKK